jgi:hypothetical protein
VTEGKETGQSKSLCPREKVMACLLAAAQVYDETDSICQVHLCEEKTVRAFSEFLFFLILLVTFLIKEKSDKREWKARKREVGKAGLRGKDGKNNQLV